MENQNNISGSNYSANSQTLDNISDIFILQQQDKGNHAISSHGLPLQRGEFKLRKSPPKPENGTQYQWLEFKIRGSVIKSILLYVICSTLWATLITLLYLVGKIPIAVPSLLVSVLSIVVGLTLGLCSLFLYRI